MKFKDMNPGDTFLIDNDMSKATHIKIPIVYIIQANDSHSSKCNAVNLTNGMPVFIKSDHEVYEVET
jgi:hypothetical protein